MTERMSVENKVAAFAWIKKHGPSAIKTIQAIEDELDRARASEERLEKRVAELEAERDELGEALEDLVYQASQSSAPEWLALDDALDALDKYQGGPRP